MTISSLHYTIVENQISQSYGAQGQDTSLASAIKDMFGSIANYENTLGHRGYCFGFYEELVVTDNSTAVDALQVKMLTIADAEAFIANPNFKESGSEWVVNYTPVDIFIKKPILSSNSSDFIISDPADSSTTNDVFDELLAQIQNQINPDLEQQGYQLAEVVDENTIKLHAQCTLKRVSV